MCFTKNIIGVRGYCDQDPLLYLDDLPGIDIVKITDIIEGVERSPKDFIDRIVSLSTRELKQNFFGKLGKMKFQISSMVGDHSLKNAGNYTWYGETDVFLSVYAERNALDRFVGIRMHDIGLMVDRDVKGKKFYVETAFGVETHEIDLRAGYNRININEFTSSEYMRIYFDVSNFKIGMSEYHYSFFKNDCLPCQYLNCSGYCAAVKCEASDDGCDWANFDFGIDVRIKCEADKCAVLKHFEENLQMPLLYKCGINFLMNAKSSNRLNEYTIDKEGIDSLLLFWNGGHDYRSDQRIKGQYWHNLDSAVNEIAPAIHQLNSKIFKRSGSRIENSLPG